MRLRHVLAPALLLAAGSAHGQGLNVVSAIGVEDAGGTVVVSVRGTRPPNFTTFSMADPPRFVIDLSEARLEGVPAEIAVNDGTVTAIKNFSYGSDASSIVRIMLAFTGEVEPPEVATQGSDLIVRVARPGGAPVARGRGAPPAAAAEEEAARRAEAERAAEARRRAEEERAAAAQVEAERAAREEAERQREAEARERESATAAAAQVEAERQRQEEAEREVVRRREEEQARERESATAAAAQVEAERQRQEEAEREVVRRREEEQAREREAAAAQAEADRRAREAAERAAREEAERQREAAVAAARVESGRSAGEALAPGAPPARLREIGFRQLPGVSRVFVRTSAPPRFTIQEMGGNVVRVELENTLATRRNDTRFLDTSFFPSAVAMVAPSRVGTSYVVDITLRERVPYQQRIEGDMLAIDFERPGAAAPAEEAAPADLVLGAPPDGGAPEADAGPVKQPASLEESAPNR